MAAVGAALALAIAACSTDGDDDDVRLGDGLLPGAPAAPGEPSPGGGLPPAPSVESPGGAPGAPPAGTSGDGSPAGPPPGPATQPSLPDASGPPGSFAPGYLRPEPASRIAVELHSQDGAGLRAASLDHLVSRMSQVTAKAVVVDGPAGFSDPRRQWSAAEVRGAAASLARIPQGGGTTVMRVLLLRGEFAEANVVGAAVEGAVMAIFVDEVARAGSPLAGSARIERAVVLHEAGHLLGLVDLYLTTGRADPDHPGHSRNEQSVMYWAVESTVVGELLGGGPPTEFDDADRRDLAAIAAGA